MTRIFLPAVAAFVAVTPAIAAVASGAAPAAAVSISPASEHHSVVDSVTHAALTSSSSTGATSSGTMPAPAASQPEEHPETAGSKVPAYWLAAADGGVFSFGGVSFYGSAGGMALNRPIVGMAATPDSGGYWLVAADGGIFSYGDAAFYGSTGDIALNQPVVGMAATPDGKGYWLVAADGGVFTFGDAAFYGSTGGMTLNQPIVAMAATSDGKGYWLVASDGGVFAFGDARFYGSTASEALDATVVGMSATPNGQGYTLLGADGGVFTFGDAQYYGSLGADPLSRPIVGMAATPTDSGYWFTDDNGAVSAFGSASYYGSAPQVLQAPVVGMAEASGTGAFAAGPYPSGSYGYDVSNYQCGDPLPSGHTIGIVQVEGASQMYTNPCLNSEAQWAGAGLNLYIFVTYGTTGSGPGVCGGDQACNFGFQTGQDAFIAASQVGVDTQVTWWLDVESNPSWSSNLSENAQLVSGAIAGLRSEGINNVGIYSSPDSWNGIVGSYQPPVPYWMADWVGSGPAACGLVSNYRASEQLPTGPVEVVQYQSNEFDDDYAC